MKFKAAIIIFLWSFLSFGQEQNSNYKTIRVAVSDSISIDSVSINPSRFQVRTKGGVVLDSSFYRIDFKRARLYLTETVDSDSLVIDYLKYPEFLTRTYKQLDENIIVENTSNLDKLYKLSQPSEDSNFRPFDGLTTSGSITRGVTIGTNQNSVLNSELDLQISGKLNDKVSLRASIQDANIPLQESGYSQRLDEFDQVFIELLSENWNIRAGDIDLVNRSSAFANFSKRVQGLSVNAKLNHNDSYTDLFAAGALVRGQFARSQFVAQEGNQGPYKLRGNNNELFVLIVSGSESVYVNGVLLERGENKDYIIDYNAGEIIFNSTFPITSEMRIIVDYQFSDRNYSRFVGFGGARYNSEKFNIGISVYTENDAKNQPLQQNLSTEQAQILAEAGDDNSLMTAPSAVSETFNENRILYRKEIIDGVEAFVFSNNPEDELFSVTFSLVGDNQGNYIISNTNAIANIFEYVPPLNGIPQGNYEPIVQLIAPVKLQMVVVNGTYRPGEKSRIGFELAGSRNDLNLFSDKDDEDNDGLAAKINIEQKFIERDSSWSLGGFINGDFIHENFRTIEVLYNPEFNRDWNLSNPTGNQLLSNNGLQLNHPEIGNIAYTFEHLNFSSSFNGNRHNLGANLRTNKLDLITKSSALNASGNQSESRFIRSNSLLRYRYHENKWAGAKFAMEDVRERIQTNDSLTPISQKFYAYEVFTGIGDSTGIFVEIGYKNRLNDSLRNNRVERVNRSNTYYLKSRLFKNQNTNLSLFVNYRTLKNENEESDDEQSLNSRLQFSQSLFNRLIQWNTIFETNSGTLPQQEFTYVEVEPGQGAYTWIDYNNNGIQELEEFEIAQFQDQGNYIRVLLPNQIFLKTHQNRLSQTVTINPGLRRQDGDKGFWRKLYNQTAFLIDRKLRREGNTINLNPFERDDEGQLGLQSSFRNTLFFNRGKQRYTTAYTYLSNASRNVLSFGFISNSLSSHQLEFNHKIKESWLVNLTSALEQQESESENFPARNFDIETLRFSPKLSYLFNDKLRFDLSYQYNQRENTIGNLEALAQQKLGVSLVLTNNQKSAVTAEFNYFSNDFEGNPNSPVGYEMMQGLQPGTNFTWSLLAQKKITRYLDLNLNYFGRKSETNSAIHTGNIQLRAIF